MVEKRPWGLVIRREDPDIIEKSVIVRYRLKLERLNPNLIKEPDTRFVTTKALQERLLELERDKPKVLEEYSGWITALEVAEPKKLQLAIYPLGTDPNYPGAKETRPIFPDLEGVGLSSLAEAQVLFDLKKSGMGDFKILRVKPSDKRKRQLRRSGRSVKSGTTVAAEYEKLRRYVVKKNMPPLTQKNKPRLPLWRRVFRIRR